MLKESSHLVLFPVTRPYLTVLLPVPSPNRHPSAFLFHQRRDTIRSRSHSHPLPLMLLGISNLSSETSMDSRDRRKPVLEKPTPGRD